MKLYVDRLPTRSLRSSSDLSQFVVPRARNKRAERAFRYAAPAVWNTLPKTIRDCSSSAMFRGHLKTFLYGCKSEMD